MDRLPRSRGQLLQLPTQAALFVPHLLNRPETGFDLRCAWNSDGVAVSLGVAGKRMPVRGRSDQLRDSDFVQLMFDTRHTAGVHRATEFCTALDVLPLDTRADDRPAALSREIAQQRSVRKAGDVALTRLWCDIRPDGYLLEVWIPGAVLYGFDQAAEIGRLGFYCVVRDTELGELPLSVGEDFPVLFDPSAWIALRLGSC